MECRIKGCKNTIEEDEDGYSHSVSTWTHGGQSDEDITIGLCEEHRNKIRDLLVKIADGKINLENI
ncbi:unnamed protein product [marine sediment metagenome]|uniref:Uncharacterized protein n=1 Tax=marine sediment metagenome TaxID=412755 RepID=X1HKI1_9ZZZZ